MKVSLESRLGMKINLDNPAGPWTAKHAAATIIKYLVRDCGNLSYTFV